MLASLLLLLQVHLPFSGPQKGYKTNSAGLYLALDSKPVAGCTCTLYSSDLGRYTDSWSSFWIRSITHDCRSIFFMVCFLVFTHLYTLTQTKVCSLLFVFCFPFWDLGEKIKKAKVLYQTLNVFALNESCSWTQESKESSLLIAVHEADNFQSTENTIWISK